MSKDSKYINRTTSWFRREWERPNSKASLIVVFLLVLAILWVLLFVIFGGNKQTNTESTATAKEPAAQAAKTPASCSPDFAQLPSEDNPNNEIVVNGAKGIEPPKEKVDYYLEYVKHRAPRIHAYATYVLPEYKASNVKSEDLLSKDKKCLSEEGKKWFWRLEGAWKSANPTNGQAPESLTNTGMNGDQLVVDGTPGIRGDRSAVVLTLGDGSKMYLLDRCGNMAIGNPHPDTPKGKTDNPPPPKEEPPVVLEPKQIGEAPQRQGNVPTQQMPNPLPKQPEHYQPTKPANPPQAYVAPTKPAPAPPSGSSAPKPAQPAPGPATPVEPNPTPITKDPEPGPDW